VQHPPIFDDYMEIARYPLKQLQHRSNLYDDALILLLV